MTALIPRARMNLYIEREHARRLTHLASQKGVSKSGVVAAALAAFLSPDGLEGRAASISKRLDRLTQQFDGLERDQSILIETLALFIRYQLSIAAAIPSPQEEAVRAQGKARFSNFLEQLARHLERGGSLVKDLHQVRDSRRERSTIDSHIQSSTSERD